MSAFGVACEADQTTAQVGRAVPVEAKSENDAVASAYLEKYGHFIDADQHGRAMAETAQELFDDARRNGVYQLLRLEPVY